MSLSVLARLLRKDAFTKIRENADIRSSAQAPAMPGTTRGTMGAMLTQPGPKDRNPDAADDKDRKTLRSPIMEAFLARTSPK